MRDALYGGMKGKTTIQAKHADCFTSDTPVLPASFLPVFPFTKTIHSRSSAIFHESNPGVCAASKIKSVNETVLSATHMIFDAALMIFSETNAIFFFIEAIFFVAENIISAMTTHFSGMEKIFLVPDTSFFAAEMSFSAAEKTAGAVPAGLFLNHPLFNVRLAFAFGRRTGMEVRHGTTSQTR